MIKQRERRRAEAFEQRAQGVCLGGGGGSSSSSSSSTSTQNIDKRLVVDNGVGVSSDSSTVNVNALDAGAIEASFQFGRDALTGADALLARGLQVLDKATTVADKSTALVATAYDNAKGDRTEKTLIAAASLAVVAIVALNMGVLKR